MEQGRQKTLIAIPTFWVDSDNASESLEGQYVYYDHPTALNESGTLQRALESLAILESSDFAVIVLAVTPDRSARTAVESRVREVLQQARSNSGLLAPCFLLSYSHLECLKEVLGLHGGQGEDADLISLDGYSNVRNAALLAACWLAVENLVFIDDDEYLDDPHFLDQATRFLGTTCQGQLVEAVAGFYRYPEGGYRLKEGQEAWQEHWNPARWMNRAFEQYLEGSARLQKSPFAFGGCLVLARSLLKRLPFDPLIPRGEDIDYLINALMLDVPTFVDNRLSVVHVPPVKTSTAWRQLRTDVRRFLYERAKLDPIQAQKSGFHPVSLQALQPYPGVLLTEDLEARFVRTHRALARAYGQQQNADAARACEKTLELMVRWTPSPEAVFAHLSLLLQRWDSLGQRLDQVRGERGVMAFLERV